MRGREEGGGGGGEQGGGSVFWDGRILSGK